MNFVVILPVLDVIKKHRGNLYFDSLYIICIGAEKIIIKNNAFIGNDSNLLIVFYVQIMPDDFVMQLHRF